MSSQKEVVMNPAYIAAEYFVEVIAKSSTSSITHQAFKILRDLVSKETSKEVEEYLDKESKNDVLFIFNKFPDIFVVTKDSICLTEVFLSLYRLKKSSKKLDQVHSADLLFYLADFAVPYFQKILNNYGPQHYLSLFHVITNDKTHQFSEHFSRCTMTDALNFFNAHASYFLLVDGMVHLKTPLYQNSSINIKADEQTTDAKTVNKVERSVYFLLACFESLHYLELIVCITYVKESAKNFFQQMSLIRQREFCENLSDATMDEFGFLSLTSEKVSFSMSNKTKALLLVVCILAFQREMHFQDLVIEVSDRIPSSINYFHVLSVEDQLRFFKKYPSYFRVSNSQHVSLLPTFVLPVCSFENASTSAKSKDSGVKAVASHSETVLQDPNTPLPNIEVINSQKSNSGNLNKLQSVVVQNPNSSSVSVNLLNISGVAKTVKERIRDSVLYLLKLFYPLHNGYVLKTLLHALDDVRISFCSLSETDKHNFIKVCCHFLKDISIEHLDSLSTSTSELTEKEKVLLFITYMLTYKKNLDFFSITAEMKQRSVSSSVLTESITCQWKYFRAEAAYFNVTSEGKVMLSQSFEPVQSIIDSYSDVLSEKQLITKNDVLQEEKKKCMSIQKKVVKDLKSVVSRTVYWNQKSESNSPSKSKLSDLEISKDWDKESNSSVDQLPEKIYKILSYSAYLLKKHFINTVTNHILLSSLFALDDLYRYFYNLSSSGQKAFVRKCYKFLNGEGHCNYTALISKEEEKVLVITYLLLTEKIMHFEKIGKKLNMYGISSLYRLTASDQFRYFKKSAVNYFLISGEGFVTLNSEFDYIRSIIKSACSTPMVQCKSKNLIPSQENSLPKLQNKITNLQAESKCTKNSFAKDLTNLENGFQALHIDSDTKNIIIDVCFYILSVCEKMTVEKLCYRLNSCNLKKLQNLFPFSTVTEKLNFFKSMSQYFNVSKDGFVSLKEDVAKTYKPKTNLDLSELVKSDSSACEEGSSRSRSESVKSIDTIRSASSSRSERRRRSRHRRRKSQNVCSTEKNNFDRSRANSECSVRNNYSKSPVKHKTNDNANNSQTFCASNSNISLNAVKGTNKNNEAPYRTVSETISQSNNDSKCVNSCHEMKTNDDKLHNREITMQREANIKLQSVKTGHLVQEHSTSKNVSVLIHKTKYLNLNQVPQKFTVEENKEQGKSAAQSSVINDNISAENNTKNVSLSVSDDTHKFKALRPSLQDNNYSKQLKSSEVLSKKNYRDFKPIEVTGSSTSGNCEFAQNKICITPKEEPAVENSYKHSAVAFPHIKNVSPFEESKVLRPSNISSTSNDDFRISQYDSSHESYITKLIDSYLGSTKSNSSSLRDRSLNSVSEHCDAQTYNNVPESFAQQTLVRNESVCETSPEVQSSLHCKKLLPSMMPNSDSVPKLSTSGTLEKMSDYNIELRAVNFFCVILGNYECYDRDISAEFLREKLSFASSEVQSFMHYNYKDNFLSFFQKHKKIFYVSPESRNIYRVKKSRGII